MINTITITGRVTAKPEVKSVKVSKKEQKSVARFSIAVSKNEYVNKGDKITVSGYLAYEAWENNDGEKRSRIYINAQSVEFMTKSENSKGNNPTKRAKSKRDEEDEAFYYDP